MPELAILVIVGLVLYFAFRSDVWRRRETSGTEDELLQLCLGDRQQAERLIALEAAKGKDISRAEAVRRAVRSLRRDKK